MVKVQKKANTKKSIIMICIIKIWYDVLTSLSSMVKKRPPKRYKKNKHNNNTHTHISISSSSKTSPFLLLSDPWVPACPPTPPAAEQRGRPLTASAAEAGACWGRTRCGRCRGGGVAGGGRRMRRRRGEEGRRVVGAAWTWVRCRKVGALATTSCRGSPAGCLPAAPALWHACTPSKGRKGPTRTPWSSGRWSWFEIWFLVCLIWRFLLLRFMLLLCKGTSLFFYILGMVEIFDVGVFCCYHLW